MPACAHFATASANHSVPFTSEKFLFDFETKLNVLSRIFASCALVMVSSGLNEPSGNPPITFFSAHLTIALSALCPETSLDNA